MELDSGEFTKLTDGVRDIVEGMVKEKVSGDRRRIFFKAAVPMLVAAISGGAYKVNDVMDSAQVAEDAKVKAEAERIKKVEGEVKNLAGAVHDTRKATSAGLLKIGQKIDAAHPDTADDVKMPDSVTEMAEDVAEIERKQKIQAILDGDAK